ncbi:PorP/SprF family type IX secretion system membrane protein [Neolewinella antarctica]|uniref:Type IX secretion system PorP/SprF family membrane protein n=1 Tax=Neolewinella antarctica TaxID=442734 RepID=A0ABX0XBK5_9BACT|nr:PorP/SprF family type IX secretion system membrane protein [Neolewinella antarctica]NJC26450.1 type IX secretion system PorP/SprF family membrane protein [Neolewinella antarctica]
MRQRLLFLGLLTTLGLSSLSGQQLSRYSMPWLDVVQFNPAYAGLDNSLSVTGSYRSQWSNLEGAPTGQRFSAHLPIYFLSSGFGIEAERDEIGARNLTTFGASYNYQIVRGNSVFSIGASARYESLGLNGSLLRTSDGIYEDPNTIIHNDALLPTGDVSQGALGIGAGVYYQGPTVEGGVSVKNLNAPVIGFEGLDYTLGRQYHGYLRARFDVLRAWEVLPFAYVISDGTQTQVSGGANLRYQENIFGGAAYRSGGSVSPDAIVLSGGFNLSDKVTVAYAYDLTLSELRTVNDGSHEITLKYNLRKRIGAGVPPPIIYYPRVKE